MEKEKKKFSKKVLLITGISLIVTIIFICLFGYWNSIEEDAYWGENGYYGYNLAKLNYEDDFITRSEFNEVEKEYKNIERTTNFFEYGIFVTGGITTIFLIATIVLRIKEKGGIKIVD